MSIKKERALSLRIQILKALVRRLQPNHPRLAEIKRELARYMKGFKGEESIDYYLDLIPEIGEYLIFHDLRLPYKNYYFQIDTLILFPSFFLILEVKNISGTLTFDPAFQQLIQISMVDGVEKEDTLPDPIEQVQRQIAQMKVWLKSSKNEPVPSEGLVIMTNSKAQIKAKSYHHLVEKYVIRNTALARKIEEMHRKYPKDLWSKKDLKKYSALLLKGNEPHKSVNIFESYGITDIDIKKGVHCPRCERIAMQRLRGTWRCSNCFLVSNEAHINSLRDFSLLIKPSITNSEFRQFIGIYDENTARRLLHSINLPHRGKTNRREYLLEFI